MDLQHPARHRHTPAWWFLLLLIPSGICQGFSLVALPYWLTQDGVSMSEVSAIVALWLLPYSAQPFLALLGDLGHRRRSGYLIAALSASLTLLFALQALSLHKLRLLSACMFVLSSSIATADNALVALAATTVHPRERGLSSGCLGAAQLTWGGLFGWGMLTLRDQAARHLGPAPALKIVAATLAAAMVLHTLLALMIDEPIHPPLPLRPRLRRLLADVVHVLRSTPGWTSLLICLAPLGTSAAAPLFGALAADYQLGAGAVGLITGVGVGAANAAGALLGGIAADRLGSRRTYLLGALSLGLCGLAMALSPTRPAYFVGCCLAYGLCSGLVYAGFYALIFELLSSVGSPPPSPSCSGQDASGSAVGVTTTCGVFMGATNLSMFYVTLLNGHLYKLSGRLGLLLGDAGCNLLGLVLVLAVLRRRDLRFRTPAQSPI